MSPVKFQHEDTFQSNDDLQPQAKEPEQLLDTPVPAATRRSTRLKKPVSRIVLSFTGNNCDTAATLISWEHMFATVHPDTHMRLLQGIDYDHVVFYAMIQLSMKAGMQRWGDLATEAVSTELETAYVAISPHCCITDFMDSCVMVKNMT